MATWFLAGVIAAFLLSASFVIGFAVGRNDRKEEARWREAGERIARKQAEERLAAMARNLDGDE